MLKTIFFILYVIVTSYAVLLLQVSLIGKYLILIFSFCLPGIFYFDSEFQLHIIYNRPSLKQKHSLMPSCERQHFQNYIFSPLFPRLFGSLLAFVAYVIYMMFGMDKYDLAPIRLMVLPIESLFIATLAFIIGIQAAKWLQRFHNF